MSPSDIEKIKLLANALDRASTACFTIGFATPLAGFVYDVAAIGSTVPFGDCYWE